MRRRAGIGPVGVCPCIPVPEIDDGADMVCVPGVQLNMHGVVHPAPSTVTCTPAGALVIVVVGVLML